MKVILLVALFIKASLIDLLRSFVIYYGDALNEYKLIAIKQMHEGNRIEIYA